MPRHSVTIYFGWRVFGLLVALGLGWGGFAAAGELTLANGDSFADGRHSLQVTSKGSVVLLADGVRLGEFMQYRMYKDPALKYVDNTSRSKRCLPISFVVAKSPPSILVTSSFPLQATGKKNAISETRLWRAKGQAGIQLRYRFSIPDGVPTSLAHGGLLFKMEGALTRNLTFSIDGVTRRIHYDENEQKIRWKIREEITIFPGDVKREFTLKPTHGKWAQARFNKQRRLFEVSITPEDTETALAISFPLEKPLADGAAAPKQKLANYLAPDRLYIPIRSVSHNLVVNPSFEAGFRYWHFLAAQQEVEPSPDRLRLIDETGGINGSRGLEIILRPGNKPPMLTPFPIISEAGKTYTVSFYARTKEDTPGVKLDLIVVTNSHRVINLNRRFPLTGTWTRYHATFKAKNNIIMPALGRRWFRNEKQTDDTTIWIDDVQVEEGGLTNFTHAPLLLKFSGRPDGTFYPADLAPVKVTLEGAAQARVEVKMQLSDFFGKAVSQSQKTFTLDAAGRADFTALYPQGAESGIYLLRIDTTSDGQKDYDFYRYTILPEVPNYQKKAIFGINSYSAYRWPEWLERLRRMGIGTFYLGPNVGFMDETQAAIKKVGLTQLGYPLFYPRYDQWQRRLLNLTAAELTPAILTALENHCRELAKKMPEVSVWKTLNEPNASRQGNANPEKALLIVKAVSRGIKAGNPKAIVLTPDLSHMYGNHLKWLDRFFALGGGKYCDAVAIHIYRPRPEEPDLEVDMARFLALLDKYKIKQDIYWTEGAYYPVYILPRFGLNAHRGCSSDGKWFCALSYDIGFGERMSTAYNMRTYLVAFKYGSRVRQLMDWGYKQRYFIGEDWVPRGLSLVPNVMGRLLGDADYVADIEIGKDFRAYLFADEKTATSVVWSYAWDVDSGAKKATFVTIPYAGKELVIRDMMGARVTPEKVAGGVRVVIGSYPIFFRVPAAQRKQLQTALANTSGPKKQYVRFRIAFQSQERLRLQARNLQAQPLSGELSLSIGADKKTLTVTLPPHSEEEVIFPLPARKPGIETLPLRFSFQPKGVSAQKMAVDLPVLRIAHASQRITIDGNFRDWPEASWFALKNHFKEYRPSKQQTKLLEKYPQPLPWRGEADLSARMAMLWNEKGLYLAYQVRDDVYAPPMADELKSSFQKDSLQLYFDCFNDGRWRGNPGSFDENDYAYDIIPLREGARVYRRVTPEAQLCFLKRGMEPAVKCVVSRENGITNYEIFYPKRYLQPIQFALGNSFGFATLINDNDNDYRKRGLTTTPANTEPYRHPEYYLSVVFSP